MQLTDTQLHQLDEQGYLILPDMFSMEEIDVLRAQIPGLIAEKCAENSFEAGCDSIRNMLSLHRRNDAFAKLIRHPRLVGPAKQILKGEDVYAQQVKVNLKTGFEGAAYEWHTDFATHQKRDGVPKPLALNLHIFLDDVDEFNGPLWFVPKSHKRDIALERSVDGEKWELWTVPRDDVRALASELGIVSAHGRRGTMLIFGDDLLHVSPPNISPFSRWIFSLILNPVSNQATKDVPEQAHERDRTPITPLDDDCLLTMKHPATHAATHTADV